MCRLIFIVLASLLNFKNGFSQDFNNYQPARCAGEVPEDFLKLSSEKAKEAMDAVQEKEIGRSEKRDEKTYAISSNFLVDELLSSGQILFGDSMTLFINKIADELLETEPKLREELRFYVYRSTVPNAYATHTGIVLLSVGLLSRVENEAQIACILAHEIQHYVKKHSLQQFKKAVELRRDLGSISRVKMDDRLKALYRFSKDAESEADMLGFRLLQKTKYNMHEGLAVFEILRYTEYPFLEITMSADSFETTHFKFPNNVHEEIAKKIAVKPVEEEDDENDENSTHPTLSKRINDLKDLLEDENIPNSGNNNIISESAFNRIQRQARCELLLLYLRSSEFGKVIYLAQVMELLHGKTYFTDQVKAMGWYGLASHRLFTHNLEDYGCNLRYAVGDWRPFLALAKSLKSKELASMAMRELFVASIEHPGDPWFEGLRDNIFTLAQKEEDLRLEDYLDFKPDVKLIDSASIDSLSKPVEPIIKNPRNRVKEKAVTGEIKNWYYSVFYDLNMNAELKLYFKKIHYEAPTVATLEMDNSRKKKKKRNAETPKVVNAVALFEPTFNQYDISGKGEHRKKYFDEEQMEIRLANRIQSLGELAEMPVTIVSGSNSERLNIEDINRYMVLNDWFIERMNNDTNAMTLWNAQFTQPVMDGLGTNYLGWMGFRFVIEKRSFEAGTMIASMIFYPTFPFYLVWQLSRDKEFSYASLVFDIRTGSVSSIQANELSHRMQNDFINAQLYQVLYNIQHASINK